MKPPIVFIDTVCPKPYSPETLKTEGMGGTEATVLRIAEELGKTTSVWVMQHNRKESDTRWNAVYKPLKTYILNPKFRIKTFVVLRNPAVAINLKRKHPDKKVWLWMHDLVNSEFVKLLPLIIQEKVGLVTVSDFHRSQVIDAMHSIQSTTWPSIRRIYNPIDTALAPDSTPVDPNKLIFLSSPHKGLNKALEYFDSARRQNPDFRLYVANPGYLPNSVSKDGVVDLGTLTHKEMIEHVRSSFCVFYPNHGFPETFGLVLADANAVGTPVLTHPLGAAPEVLGGREQLVDCRNLPSFIDKLMKWQKNRPTVKGQDAFRLDNVIKSWYTLLEV